MAFESIVEIYRLAGKPDFDNDTFEATLQLEQIRGHLASAKSFGKARIEVDGNDLERDAFDLSNDGEVTVQVRLMGGGYFCRTASDLFGQICKGSFPETFYLIDCDYLAGDEPTPTSVSTLKSLCALIGSLAELAPYHDSKSVSGHQQCASFVFIKPKVDDEIRTLVVDTVIDQEVFDSAEGCDFSLAIDLAAERPETHPNCRARKAVFTTALTDYLSGLRPREAFRKLVIDWDAFSQIFHQDMATYQSGFAFHKAKREIAHEQIDLASQQAKVVSDIAGKALGVPVSLALVVGITRAETPAEVCLLLLGLLILSLILAYTVQNQQLQLRSVVAAQDLVFQSLEGKRVNYPSDLQSHLVKAESSLTTGATQAKRILVGVRALCWLPSVLGAAFALWG